MTHDVSPDPDKPDTGSRRLRAAAVVIYATLLLLAIAIPQSVVNRLGDFYGYPVQETALRGATALQTFAQRTGVAAPYVRARALFLAWSGKGSD
jgi:hypothetical protein